jgi:hypothetical protein
MKKTSLFWILPLLIVALLAGVLLYVQKSQTKLSISWHNTELHIYPGIERPYIVTHLIVPSDSHSRYKSAALEPPLLIWDSAGRILYYDQIQKLKWVDYLGNDVEPPKIGSNISAIYYCSDITEKSSIN